MAGAEARGVAATTRAERGDGGVFSVSSTQSEERIDRQERSTWEVRCVEARAPALLWLAPHGPTPPRTIMQAFVLLRCGAPARASRSCDRSWPPPRSAPPPPPPAPPPPARGGARRGAPAPLGSVATSPPEGKARAALPSPAGRPGTAHGRREGARCMVWEDRRRRVSRGGGWARSRGGATGGGGKVYARKDNRD